MLKEEESGHENAEDQGFVHVEECVALVSASRLHFELHAREVRQAGAQALRSLCNIILCFFVLCIGVVDVALTHAWGKNVRANMCPTFIRGIQLSMVPALLAFGFSPPTRYCSLKSDKRRDARGRIRVCLASVAGSGSYVPDNNLCSFRFCIHVVLFSCVIAASRRRRSLVSFSDMHK